MKKIILVITLLITTSIFAQKNIVGGVVMNRGAKGEPGIDDSKNIKYLTALEVGLVGGDINTTSPFTTQEYDDAYNNGINLATAIKNAYDNGFRGVVVERGTYPLASNAGSTTIASGSASIAMLLTGLKDFNINFNGSTFFLIYDSNNKSTYDTSADAAHLLPYQGIRIEKSTNLSITNLEMRGDNYMRSWITGEDGDIGCYGIVLSKGTVGIKIENYIGHGFRCEPLAINAGGTGYKSLTWTSGGIDPSTGDEIVETGSFRTQLVEAITTTGTYELINNSVTLIGSGYVRELKFKNSIFQIAYYDASSVFIMSETSAQNKLNHLPVNCKYVRYTVFDETEVTPDYSSIIMTSGTPRSLEVNNSQFFYNMRGGIAGCANNTIIRNSVFHNIGQVIEDKLGWMAYNDTTTFGINVEDGMSDFLRIEGCRFENVDHAFLTPACQTIIFKNNISEGNTYSSVINTVKYAEVSGNIFYGNNYTDGLSVLSDSDRTGRSTKITNNTFVNSKLTATAINDDKNNIYISGNDYINTKVEYEGNVIADKNVHSGFVGAFTSPVSAINVLLFNDIIEEKEGFGSWQRYVISARNKISSSIINIKNSVARNTITDAIDVPSIYYKSETEQTISYEWDISNVIEQNQYGTTYENLNLYYGSGNSYDSLPNLTVNFNNTKLINSRFNLGRRTTINGGVLTLNFNNCVLDFTDASSLYILTNSYTNTGGQLIMNFDNCTFKSDTSKTIAITTGVSIVGLTTNLEDCNFYNVIITGSTEPIQSKLPDENCPTYADNSTALAALGSGYYYKLTSTGEFKITY
ncbi:right-handed parallel beta-helix repeat-containing protein [Thalassobellus suaedae]|uniref:Right-handed parallel beta-helix repeat-containing protein n=1 Tax=Thalassobellus suaedae TaxID=3074124 RepID=A0ABY9XVW7_9FLAO|nr:right-handed parallel beta-helix repeat-containing protein [Flavobacteriaceae bacterium HL-DH14]